MGRFRDRLTRFMYGRYGVDQLNRFLMGIVMISLVLSLFVPGRVFYWITVLGILLSYFRMFSKNIRSRSQENNKYLQATAGIRRSFSRMKSRSRDKSHCYFKCPSCRQTVRVPKGKGKICITCPKCGGEFVKRT